MFTDQYLSTYENSNKMGFYPAFTSTWDSPLLNEMLDQLRAGDSTDVTMVMKDSNHQDDSEGMVIEETVEINSTIEEVTEMDSINTENSDPNKEEAYEMFEVTIVIEDTIEIEDTFEDTIEIEDTFNDTSDQNEDSNYSEEGSGLEDGGVPKYFAGCPVHNHHTDQESMCPDDPPCVCLGEV